MIQSTSPARKGRAVNMASVADGKYIDFIDGDGADPRFSVAGILPTCDETTGATSTTIYGILWEDGAGEAAAADIKEFKINLYQAHPLAFRRIYKDGTTCTKFILLGQ